MLYIYGELGPKQDWTHLIYRPIPQNLSSNVKFPWAKIGSFVWGKDGCAKRWNTIIWRPTLTMIKVCMIVLIDKNTRTSFLKEKEKIIFFPQFEFWYKVDLYLYQRYLSIWFNLDVAFQLYFKNILISLNPISWNNKKPSFIWIFRKKNQYAYLQIRYIIYSTWTLTCDVLSLYKYFLLR